jgi:hypothetical protein
MDLLPRENLRATATIAKATIAKATPRASNGSRQQAHMVAVNCFSRIQRATPHEPGHLTDPANACLCLGTRKNSLKPNPSLRRLLRHPKKSSTSPIVAEPTGRRHRTADCFHPANTSNRASLRVNGACWISYDRLNRSEGAG